MKKRKLNINDFNQLCDSYLPANLSRFVKAQADIHKRKPQGSRYDNKYKEFALSLYFTSQKTYRLLSKTFVLPTIKSLQRMTQLLDFKPGFNDFVFEALKLKLKSLSNKELICSLCFDEMALKTNLFYSLSFGHLIIPSANFVSFVTKMDCLFKDNFEELSISTNVGANMLDIFKNIYEPPCIEFPKEYVMKLFCRLKIFHTLKYANSELKSLPRKQRKAINIMHL